MGIKEKLLLGKARFMGFLAQEELSHSQQKSVTPGMPQLLRAAAAEGAVLLENRVLPLAKGTRVALFGRIQLDWFFTGYGSGGDVNNPYGIHLLEGLRNCADLQVNEELAAVYEQWVQENPAIHGSWGKWPRFHPEMPVTEELVSQARTGSDTAVIVLGRSSGEDRENLLQEGSYYLTLEERRMITTVTAQFPDAVLVLNIGSLMDLSFLEEFSFGAVLIAWQGGMESGNAVADLLCGKQTPSGRLAATAARCYDACPSASHFGAKKANEYFEDIYVGYRWFETFAQKDVLYPFGYGVSYTTFAVESRQTDDLVFQVKVTNTGNFPGKETVMLFVSKPQGCLGNPARELVAFGKTDLLAPGESQELELRATFYQLSSYDDSGITGHKSCYVLLPGTYRFCIGSNVREAAAAGEWNQEELRVLKRHQEQAAPAAPFPIVTVCADETGLHPGIRQASARTVDLKKRILRQLPAAITLTEDLGHTLQDVKAGKVTLEAFIAQLSLEELEALSRGAYTMNSPLGPRGNAGVFGGVTESLRKKGIAPVTTTDGPSGIRLYESCSLVPIGTLLACTFNKQLVQELYTAVGQEMKERGSDVLLAPGMNIQRDPLCGRNFEYYSEDPYLTGIIAAATVRGVQSQGLSACPKHFACNNQETNRIRTDSILSERALREVYLRGFEICVKQAKPKNIMTSYNKINSVWGHYHYELVQGILRGEWNYEGNVITDWWMRYAPCPEFPKLKGNAYRVRAGVDVLMPGSRFHVDRRRTPDGTLLETYGQKEGITLGELQRCAANVLRCVMELKE